MIEEQALVTRVEGQQVYLQSMQSSACQHCVQKASCGTELYAKILPRREMTLFSPLPLTAGDTVLVGIEENHLLRASAFMYLLPLLVMLLSVGLVHASEEMTALIAITSLCAGLYLVHHLQQLFTKNLMRPPNIIKKL